MEFFFPKSTRPTLWILELTWVFRGCWLSSCFSTGSLDWLEIGSGSVAEMNLDDHSMSFWLRISSLSVTKDTMRVSSRSNKCRCVKSPWKKWLNRIFICLAKNYQKERFVRLTTHSYNLCLYLLALPVDCHHAPFFVFEAFTQNQPWRGDTSSPFLWKIQ